MCEARHSNLYKLSHSKRLPGAMLLRFCFGFSGASVAWRVLFAYAFHGGAKRVRVTVNLHQRGSSVIFLFEGEDHVFIFTTESGSRETNNRGEECFGSALTTA